MAAIGIQHEGGAEQRAAEHQRAACIGARDFLEHALGCPADHPVDECPHMIEALDKRLDGLTIEELAAETGQAVPSAS